MSCASLPRFSLSAKQCINDICLNILTDFCFSITTKNSHLSAYQKPSYIYLFIPNKQKMTDADSKTTCISEHDRALTVNALEEFNKWVICRWCSNQKIVINCKRFSNNYGTCIQNLVELESSIGVDPCIIHNKAVAEFYKSDFKNYEQFLKVLNQLIGKVTLCKPNIEPYFVDRIQVFLFCLFFLRLTGGRLKQLWIWKC